MQRSVPLITISVLGVALNVLPLVAFLKDPLKCPRNSGTYLVMNLAVSDCLMCLFAPSFLVTDVIPSWHWIFEFVVLWFGNASFVSIASISIDRFLLVAYPIKDHIKMKRKVIVLFPFSNFQQFKKLSGPTVHIPSLQLSCFLFACLYASRIPSSL